MVCDRCKMVVREQFQKLGYEVLNIELGKVVIKTENPDQHRINETLQQFGFELLQGRDQQLTEKVKTLLIAYLEKYEEAEKAPNISDYLVSKLAMSYSKISSQFSGAEGTTIERYLILLKIERVKELVSYNEMTLSEIAMKLNYSSTAHLSNQFRKVTGMSVTDFKKIKESLRRPLDSIN